ncbi:MAG: hypothetical protein WC872_04615 [Candidatus Absconditabacterales bacterium]
MGDTSGAKHKHFLYNVNLARKKSGIKPQKAMLRYINLLKKESKEGMTKWIGKTKLKAEGRLKKFGITTQMVQNKLEKKGLKNLSSNHPTNHGQTKDKSKKKAK